MPKSRAWGPRTCGGTLLLRREYRKNNSGQSGRVADVLDSPDAVGLVEDGRRETMAQL